jgi:hypothetical protein
MFISKSKFIAKKITITVDALKVSLLHLNRLKALQNIDTSLILLTSIDVIVS